MTQIDDFYDPRRHIEELAVENLTTRDRRRVMTCLQRAPAVLQSQETVIALTDTVVDGRVGLCVVTDLRLLVLDEDLAGSVAHEIELDEATEARVHGQGDLSDITVSWPAGNLTLESVGDTHWAHLVARSIADGVPVSSARKAVPSPETTCPGCGSLIVLAGGKGACATCGLHFDNSLSPPPRKHALSPELAALRGGPAPRDDGSAVCPLCAEQIQPDAVICRYCGADFRTLGPAVLPPRQKPETHLVGAIVTTLLCCVPFGVVAIVYASQVDSLWRAEDWPGAVRASAQARKWINIAVLVSVLFLVGSVVFGYFLTP